MSNNPVDTFSITIRFLSWTMRHPSSSRTNMKYPSITHIVPILPNKPFKRFITHLSGNGTKRWVVCTIKLNKRSPQPPNRIWIQNFRVIHKSQQSVYRVVRERAKIYTRAYSDSMRGLLPRDFEPHCVSPSAQLINFSIVFNRKSIRYLGGELRISYIFKPLHFLAHQIISYFKNVFFSLVLDLIRQVITFIMIVILCEQSDQTLLASSRI